MRSLDAPDNGEDVPKKRVNMLVPKREEIKSLVHRSRQNADINHVSGLTQEGREKRVLLHWRCSRIATTANSFVIGNQLFSKKNNGRKVTPPP